MHVHLLVDADGDFYLLVLFINENRFFRNKNNLFIFFSFFLLVYFLKFSFCNTLVILIVIVQRDMYVMLIFIIVFNLGN